MSPWLEKYSNMDGTYVLLYSKQQEKLEWRHIPSARIAFARKNC